MQALIAMDKNNFVESMDLNGDHDLNFYDELMYGKHHCTLFLLSGGFRAKEILGFVHINICGPMVTSHEGAKYFYIFIDDFLRKTFLYTMKTKFGVTNKNLVICNHSLCGYVQFNPTYNYEWFGCLCNYFSNFDGFRSSFQLIAIITYFIFPKG